MGMEMSEMGTMGEMGTNQGMSEMIYDPTGEIRRLRFMFEEEKLGYRYGSSLRYRFDTYKDIIDRECFRKLQISGDCLGIDDLIQNTGVCKDNKIDTLLAYSELVSNIIIQSSDYLLQGQDNISVTLQAIAIIYRIEAVLDFLNCKLFDVDREVKPEN